MRKYQLLVVALLAAGCTRAPDGTAPEKKTTDSATAAPQPAAPKNASPANAPMGDLQSPQSESARTFERTLAGCQPHLQSRPVPLPQIDLSAIGDPGAQRIKMKIMVGDDGTVSEETIEQATFGLPSEHQALLNYARNLRFAVPQNEACRNLETEVIGEAFEERSRIGRWSLMIRLYPKYSLDRRGNLQIRE
ncbi:MAG TPA: hypothetical protein VGI32_11425 [Steroidobacteraceae bacterium]